MSLVNERSACLTLRDVLTEYDTDSAGFFFDVSADDKVLVDQVFDLDPVLCSHARQVFAVLPFCDDPLKVLFFRKLVKSGPVVFDIS